MFGCIDYMSFGEKWAKRGDFDEGLYSVNDLRLVQASGRTFPFHRHTPAHYLAFTTPHCHHSPSASELYYNFT